MKGAERGSWPMRRIKAGVLAGLLYRPANDSRMHSIRWATFLGLTRATLRALEPIFGQCAIEQGQLLGIGIITLGWVCATVSSWFRLVVLTLRQSSVAAVQVVGIDIYIYIFIYLWW